MLTDVVEITCILSGGIINVMRGVTGVTEKTKKIYECGMCQSGPITKEMN